MLVFPDTTVLVNLAFIQRMDLLETLCAGGNGRWVERVQGETYSWREEEPTASIAEADRILGPPVLLNRAQRQEARILRNTMAKAGESELRHLGEAQTLVVAGELAASEPVTFVTDDRSAARYALDRNIRPLGTGDVLSLLCKAPAEQARNYYSVLTGARHYPAWHRLARPDWA